METQHNNSEVLAPILSTLDTLTIRSNNIVDNIQEYIDQHSGSEDAFYLIDLDHICRKYYEWRELMPRVQPHYAVKCNPNKNILKTLKNLGVHFDCASKEEIEAVVSLGDVDAEKDIIYANPTKPKAHLLAAKREGVKLMTFDNTDELYKIKATYPEAQLVLRIMTDDSKATCRFSAKYGAPMSACVELLKLALELQLSVVGVSFHVGSGQKDPSAFADAVERAYRVFQIAKELGFHFNLLDIGGGFPGGSDEEGQDISLSAIAAHMRPKLDELFPESSNVHIIAEPGRYFAHGAFTLICNVIARRDTSTFQVDSHTNAEDVVNYIYYINDGVYGSFNCKFFDHYVPKMHMLKQRNAATTLYPSTVFGPTCDALDCIYKRENLPLLNVGDWVYFPGMGAYTTAAASCFNGFQRPKEIYLRRRPNLF